MLKAIELANEAHDEQSRRAAALGKGQQIIMLEARKVGMLADEIGSSGDPREIAAMTRFLGGLSDFGYLLRAESVGSERRYYWETVEGSAATVLRGI